MAIENLKKHLIFTLLINYIYIYIYIYGYTMKPKCMNLTIFTLLFSHFQATEKLQNQFFFDFLIF
jgi:hypothetical protein